MTTLLLDEHSEPSFRHVLGARLADAARADFAVTRIRLARVDLSAHELARIEACRVLVGRLDIEALAQGGESTPRGPGSDAILQLIDSGRLEVRAAGLQAWYPDFSVLRGPAGRDTTAFIGAHYFGQPYPSDGPALTCIVTDPAQAAAATSRFDELWRRGYDVSQVVRSALAPLNPACG